MEGSPNVASGGPPLRSIEVNKTAPAPAGNGGGTTSSNHHHHAALPLSSGQSTPTTIGTGSLLTATTAVGAAAAAGSNDANVHVHSTAATDSTTANSNSALPPTVPYRSAGGLASERPAAVLSATNHGGFHNPNAGIGGGGASVSTISPGSLAGNGNGNGHPTTGNNTSNNGGGNAVEFTARDATALRPPDLSMGIGVGVGIGVTTPNPHGNSNGGNNDIATAAAASARPSLSIDASASADVPPPSSSIAPSTANATSPPTSSRPSPRGAALRSNLDASRTTLHASLHSYHRTQNTHLDSAFGALLQSIQEHTEELDVHRDNLDRLDQEIHGPNVDAPLRPTVTHLQTDLTHLQTNVKSIREEVEVVYDKFQHLDGVVSGMETNASEVEGDVRRVQARVEEVDGRVTAAETSTIAHVQHLRTELETARTQLALLANDVTAPTGKVATLTARLDAVTTELSATRTDLVQQIDALNGTTTQLLQTLETDTLRKFDDANTAHAQAVQQLESMNGLVQTLRQDNAALKQLVDDHRMQEAQNRAALEQSLQAGIASVQSELEQDRSAHRAMVGEVSKTNDSLERIDQDVQGLRLLDRERNRQLVELAALPGLLSSMQAEVDSLKEGQARGVATDGAVAAAQAREENLQAELAKLSREVEGLRQLDSSRAQEMTALAAMRQELASTRAELEEMKMREAEGRAGAATASRGIDLNAEISRVQEKTKQLRSSPPSSVTRAMAEPEEHNVPFVRGAVIDAGEEPGEIVSSAASIENDPNDQINAALDGLRQLQASLNQDRPQAQAATPAGTSAADRLNARNAARSGGSAPSSAQTSPVAAERKLATASESYQPQEKSPKAIESAPQDNNAREEVSLLRQAREEIDASLATLQMGSSPENAPTASPPGSPSRDIGAAGHTPAPAGRPLSSADPIMDAARRRMRDDDSPMVSGHPASFAPDPSAPNVSRGGALPSQAVRASSIGTGTLCEKSISVEVSDRQSTAPTPARGSPVQQLDYESIGGDQDRGMDPPDEASPARATEAQRYSDPPEDEDSSLVAQVPYYKVPPVAQESEAVTAEATESKGVILIQKTTDERKKYQYYDPVQDKQQVVEQHSTSVEREITETTEVVASETAAVTAGEERGVDASAEAPPSPQARAANHESPESSPDTSKWSTKTAGELIEQRRMQRMLAGRATMEAAVKTRPPPPPQDAAENNLSPRSAAPFSRTNPPARDAQDPQQSIRQQQMRKARQPQGRQSSAAAPSRHRSIVEEAIQFARASRGSPAAPSKDMATSPKDFLSKQNKTTQQQRRQQRMEKDFGPSPTNACSSTEMSSPRMDSEQSMVVTPDEKSPASANNMSDELANGIQLEPSPMAARSPDDFENLRRATSSGPSAISPINAQQPAPAQVMPPPASTVVQSNEPTPGCYLVYFADSGGKLVLHYSKTPVENAIGFWRAGQGKSIQGFKYRQNSGRVELIKGIAGGDANKRKFFSGWCQFIKAAAAFNGSARKFPNAGGLEVELYAVSKDGTVHFLDVDNEEVDVSQFDAIACLPKNNNLFKGVHNLDVNRFVNTANIAGAALPL